MFDDFALGHTVVCPDTRGYGRSSKPPYTRCARATGGAGRRPRGHTLDGGHHLAEDVPDELAEAIRGFSADRAGSVGHGHRAFQQPQGGPLQ